MSRVLGTYLTHVRNRSSKLRKSSNSVRVSRPLPRSCPQIVYSRSEFWRDGGWQAKGEGEEEDRDQEDRGERGAPGDLHEAPHWALQEGGRALRSLRGTGRCRRLLPWRQALRLRRSCRGGDHGPVPWRSDASCFHLTA